MCDLCDGIILREIGSTFWGETYSYDNEYNFPFAQFRKLYRISGYCEWTIIRSHKRELYEVVKKQVRFDNSEWKDL